MTMTNRILTEGLKNRGKKKNYRMARGIAPFLLFSLMFMELLPHVTSQQDNTTSKPYGAQLAFILIFAAALITFVMFYFWLVVRRLRSGRVIQMERGLDPRVIKTLPSVVYGDVKRLESWNGVQECVVCLEEFKDEDKLQLLPTCTHSFHVKCIGAWLSCHSTCPVCRAKVANKRSSRVTPVNQNVGHVVIDVVEDDQNRVVEEMSSEVTQP